MGYIMFLWGFALVVTAFADPCSAASQKHNSITQEEAQRVIEHVINLPHGTRFASSEDRELVKNMVGHPDVFLPLLAHELEVLKGDGNVVPDAGRIVRCARVLGLVAEFSSQCAAKLVRISLRHAFRLVDRLRSMTDHEEGAVGEARASLSALELFCGCALDRLADYGDDGVVEDVIVRLEGANIATQTAMLRYLEKVSPLRPDIRPKLEKMYHSPDSPLRNHPQLLRVLEAIDKAEAKRREMKPNAATGPPRSDMP